MLRNVSGAGIGVFACVLNEVLSLNAQESYYAGRQTYDCDPQ